MEALQPGVVLAQKYRLTHKLGEGGMGVVWAATHVITQQPVALKLLLPEDGDSTRIKRFMREARAASAVKHPNVVVVHDVVELDERTPMMVMEMLEGESLGERLDRERKLPLPEVARVLLPVISALGCAHAAGIVHRDVKPDNIFLERLADGGANVKVLDFGIAKLTALAATAQTGSLTATDSLVGTPYYMAPEQVFGEKDVDHRVDVWALGVIAYECLTGVRPTEGDNVGQILKVISTQRIVPIGDLEPDLPQSIRDVVTRSLSLERSARPTLQELLDAFKPFTDVRVRGFGVARSPSSASLLPSSSDSGAHVVRVSEGVSGDARTVDAAARGVRVVPTTLDEGVTRPRERAPSRWGIVGVGAALVVSVLAIAGVVTRFRSSPRTDAANTAARTVQPEPPTATMSAIPAVPSTPATSATSSMTVEPQPTASVRTASHAHSAATTSSGATPTNAASSTPPVASVKKTSPGGVVEQTPY